MHTYIHNAYIRGRRMRIYFIDARIVRGADGGGGTGGEKREREIERVAFRCTVES